MSSPRRRRLINTILVFGLGSVLHFCFDWFGEWRPIALFAAVNESVWEHLKIAFWPALLLAALQTASEGQRASAWSARGFGLLTTSATIAGVFYGYTAVLGVNLLVIDIAIFAIAVFIGQWCASVLTEPLTRVAWLRLSGILLLAAQVTAFSLFTFAPPPLGLFEDPRTGRYGLDARSPADPIQRRFDF